MSEIIEFRLASGEVVYVEAAGGPGAKAGRVGGAERVAHKASETFEKALERVKPAARAVVEAFRELNQPDEIALEFGLAFETSVNAYVLTGDASASFKLSLTWKSDRG